MTKCEENLDKMIEWIQTLVDKDDPRDFPPYAVLEILEKIRDD